MTPHHASRLRYYHFVHAYHPTRRVDALRVAGSFLAQPHFATAKRF